jgi:hypothetical protein
MAILEPNRIAAVGFTLFRALLIDLEKFDIHEFESGTFFYPIELPVWHSSYPIKALPFTVEIESRLAMQKLVELPGLADQIAERIGRLVSQPYCYYCLTTNPHPRKSLHVLTILTRCIVNGEAVPMDHVIPIDATTNHFVPNTSIELLLLIKNFVHLAKTVSHRNRIRMAMIDLFARDSPLAIRYLHEFMDLIRLHILTSPLDNQDDYRDRLLLLGKVLCTNPDPVMLAFYAAERVSFTFCSRDVCILFPEFFTHGIEFDIRTRSFPAPQRPLIDGKSIGESDIDALVARLLLTIRHYQGIVGFPFWEVLPYWLELRRPGVIGAEVTTSPDGHQVINNQSGSTVLVRFDIRSFPRDAVIMISHRPDFGDPRFVQRGAERQTFNLTDRQAFISYIGFAHPDHARAEILDVVDAGAVERPRDIDADEIRAQFLEDMRQFAAWTPQEDQDLLQALQACFLCERTFSQASQVADGCALVGRFSRSVVRLKTLFLY